VDGLVDLVIGERGRDAIGDCGLGDGARHDSCGVGELSTSGSSVPCGSRRIVAASPAAAAAVIMVSVMRVARTAVTARPTSGKM
jgi:hypothetical protein